MIENLPVDCLLTTHHQVVGRHVLQYAQALKNGQQVAPIRVVSYPEDSSKEYIVFDGNTRSAAAASLDRQTIEGIVYNSDDELRSYIEERLAGTSFYRTIQAHKPYSREKLRKDYETLWRPRLLRAGIRTVKDI